MSDSMITELLVHTGDSAAKQKALAYPSLSRAESWRWTPLKALRSISRRVDCAAYQYDFPDAVQVSETDEARDLDMAFLHSQIDAPFAAVNMALADDVLHIRIPAQTFEQPLAIHLDAVGKKWQFSRMLIEVAAEAKAALWLDMRAEREAAQLPLIALEVGANSEFDMVLWLGAADEGAANTQCAYIGAKQQAHSKLRINAVQSGAALARVDVQAEIHGAEAEFLFGGIQMLSGEQVGDYHVNVRHMSEGSQSNQVVRGALRDKSNGIFDGMIYVAHGAQQTDAKQDSRYILLSDEAKSHSVSRLEIYADDVQCAHGSTVGFLDPESLFYLQSRGIDLETAQVMLISSFLHEAVVVEHGALAANLHEAISQTWTGGDED